MKYFKNLVLFLCLFVGLNGYSHNPKNPQYVTNNVYKTNYTSITNTYDFYYTNYLTVYQTNYVWKTNFTTIYSTNYINNITNTTNVINLTNIILLTVYQTNYAWQTNIIIQNQTNYVWVTNTVNITNSTSGNWINNELLFGTLGVNQSSAIYRKISSNGVFYVLHGGKKVTVWNDAGNYTNLVLHGLDNLAIGNGGSIEILGNRIFVSDFAYTSPDISNYVQEYSLDNFQNGLPTVANLITNYFFNKDGRQVDMIKTTNNTIIAASMAFSPINNNAIAYRNKNGEWKFYKQEYEPYLNQSPSFNYKIAQGTDGKIYIFASRDTTATITLARWVENNGELNFYDFRGDFLYSQCGYVIDKFVCRDGVMCPEVEFPRLELSKDKHNNNRILLSYQGMIDSKYVSQNCLDIGWWRVARVAIVSLDIINQQPNAEIISSVFVGQNIYISFKSIIGIPYIVQINNDSTNWVNLKNVYTRDTDNIATNITTTITCLNPYYVATNPISYPLKVIARNYTRSPVLFTPEFTERDLTYVPMLPQADGIYFFFNEFNTNICSMDETFFRKYDYASKTPTNALNQDYNTKIDYSLKAWEEDIPYIVINRTNNFYIKKIF